METLAGRSGSTSPPAGRPQAGPGGQEKAERYLLVAATELYTHYLLGDRSMDTFKAFVVVDMPNSR